MTDSLKALGPALQMLGKQIRILPATGGAIEELERPDEDELEDALVNRDSGDITDFAEHPQPSPDNLYRPTPPLYRADKQLYHFFIDGSRRIQYLGTGIEGDRSFPIEFAQIGAAVIHRDNQGKVHALGINHRLLLLIPKGPLGLSDTVWTELERLNTQSLLVVNTATKQVNVPSSPTPENLRAHATGIASNLMHKLEIETISLTARQRDNDHWLILDGGVKWDEFIREKYMIGVAKNFRKNPRFTFGGKKPTPIDITQVLAKLPYAHRTVAFSTYNHRIAFWYVRLRKIEEVDYPLQGVVKVELPLLDQQSIEADQADLISRTLVAERNVTPYGRDSRWHCHLYPIFQAEEAIKRHFYSQQVIKGMVRWPKILEQEA